MSTARFLVLMFGGLVLMSAVAMVWKPNRTVPGKTPLVWVSDNNPARSRQIEAFNAEHPDLDLRLDYGNAGVQKIILQCSSGIGPDLFDYGAEEIGAYAEAGILWDITDRAASLGVSPNQHSWPNSVSTFTYRGRQLGFPCNTGSNILVYNKNVFDYFGVPYPREPMTWEEFIQMARQVNSPTHPRADLKRPIYAISGAEWHIFFYSLRGEFFTAEGRLDILASTALRRAFETYRAFLFEHRLTPTAVEARTMSGQGGWKAGSLNQFASGRYAMVITGHWALISLGRAHRQQVDELQARGLNEDAAQNPLDRPLRIGAVLIPHYDGHPPGYLVQSRVAGINARSPRREEALQFLSYLAGPTYSRLLNEGFDWLPGNPRHAGLGLAPGHPALARMELQDATVRAMNHGYVPARSPYLLTSDVIRVLGEQISRMESNPDLPVESLLQTATRDLQTLMRRNLERDPVLRKSYIAAFGARAMEDLR